MAWTTANDMALVVCLFEKKKREETEERCDEIRATTKKKGKKEGKVYSSCDIYKKCSSMDDKLISVVVTR